MNVLHHLAVQFEALVILLQQTHSTCADKLTIPGFALAGSSLSRKHGLSTFVHHKAKFKNVIKRIHGGWIFSKTFVLWKKSYYQSHENLFQSLENFLRIGTRRRLCPSPFNKSSTKKTKNYDLFLYPAYKIVPVIALQRLNKLKFDITLATTSAMKQCYFAVLYEVSRTKKLSCQKYHLLEL